MIFDNQLRHAAHIVDTYHGETPLHVWLKDFFRNHKQMGARDRRFLSTITYSYYRLGHAIRHLPPEQRLLAGLYLCNDQPSEFLNYFRPSWDPTAPLDDKLAFFLQQPEAADFRVTDIFPWHSELSDDIDPDAFCRSFLIQPDLFLRIRPGHEQMARQNVPGEFIAPFTLRLPNGFKVEQHLTPDREVVIQDYSSQCVSGFLQSATPPRTFWDACAASGGKSILARDLYPGMEIIVSDIRDTILHNLHARFRTAGIENYESFSIDLAIQSPPKDAAGADLILADVPCTGSGTWGRTPEQLYFFHPKKILHYNELQKKILEHIVPQLAPDASLVYCTCSVFKKENEEIDVFLREQFGLHRHKMEHLKGYDQRADTLFAARYTRPLINCD